MDVLTFFNITDDTHAVFKMLEQHPQLQIALCKVSASNAEIGVHGDILVGFMAKNSAVSFDLP